MAKKCEEKRMNIKKKLLLIPVGMLLLVATVPSHARGGVYGNVGYNDYPWSVLIGYSDYGHGYNRGHRHGPSCGHGGYYYKKHHYKHKKHHYKRHHDYDYGYRDRHHYKHKRHHYKRDRHHYNKHRDRRHHAYRERHYDRGHDNYRSRDREHRRDRRHRDGHRDNNRGRR